MPARRDAAGPPIVYDGGLYWYTQWHDPHEDRCSVCRELIPEDDVPLILFRTVGHETWMARIHFEPCAQPWLSKARSLA